MKGSIIYVELKSGCGDRGPAWIGRAAGSKSGKTIYFNGKAFKSCKGRGIGANYFDMETGEEYWISRVKRNQQDRHWAGGGKIFVDRSVLADYLITVGATKLDPHLYELVDLEHSDIRQKIEELENKKYPAKCNRVFK